MACESVLRTVPVSETVVDDSGASETSTAETGPTADSVSVVGVDDRCDRRNTWLSVERCAEAELAKHNPQIINIFYKRSV